MSYHDEFDEEPTSVISLRKIADALGVSTSDLIRASEVKVNGISERSAALNETMELVSLFSEIEDQQARNRCLAFVRLQAKKPEV